MMRYGENPLQVVERLKEKIKRLEPGLPQKTLADGRVSKVKVVSFYDRTDIVTQTIDTLKEALLEEVMMASAVILISSCCICAARFRSSSRCRCPSGSASS
jgi:Cu(I)/Ag(I) efflux system membrane protein CusA/SilA